MKYENKIETIGGGSVRIRHGFFINFQLYSSTLLPNINLDPPHVLKISFHLFFSNGHLSLSICAVLVYYFLYGIINLGYGMERGRGESK